MQYRELVTAVQQLEFITDEQAADTAIKAVVGILASRMSETQAAEFLKHLPEPLTVEHLRGHQQPQQSEIPSDVYAQEIQEQFKLSEQQSQELIDTVLRQTKEAIPEEKQDELLAALPSGWQEIVRSA